MRVRRLDGLRYSITLDFTDRLSKLKIIFESDPRRDREENWFNHTIIVYPLKASAFCLKACMCEREGVRWCIHKLLLVWSLLRGLIFHTPSFGYIHLRPPRLIGVDVQRVCGQGRLCAGHLDIDWCRFCAEECRVQYKNRLRQSHKFSDQRNQGNREDREKEWKSQLGIEAPGYELLFYRPVNMTNDMYIHTWAVLTTAVMQRSLWQNSMVKDLWSLWRCVHYWNSVIRYWSHCVFYRMSLELAFFHSKSFREWAEGISLLLCAPGDVVGTCGGAVFVHELLNHLTRVIQLVEVVLEICPPFWTARGRPPSSSAYHTDDRYAQTTRSEGEENRD